ncbi:MAG: membrane protein insertion efficiency factor YidD [Crocinitomicaceae bacterium]
MELLKRILILPLLLIVKIYQYVISPISPASCRYSPTCSNYMIGALKEWGLLKGVYLGVKRILSCHPWGGQGFDPVPKKNK